MASTIPDFNTILSVIELGTTVITGACIVVVLIEGILIGIEVIFVIPTVFNAAVATVLAAVLTEVVTVFAAVATEVLTVL
jgi:hypothetical protein